MPKDQPRDLIDPTSMDKDDHLPGYTDYFDKDSGIKRYQNLNQRNNDLQASETVQSRDKISDVQDEPTRLGKARTSEAIGLDAFLKRSKGS